MASAHEPGSGVVDAGCGKGVIGDKTLEDHKEVMEEAGLSVKAIRQAKATTFRFGNQETLESMYGGFFFIIGHQSEVAFEVFLPVQFSFFFFFTSSSDATG